MSFLTMTRVYETLASIPLPVQWFLAGVGCLFLAVRLFSFVHLLLNTFVLSGINVRTS